MEITLREHLRKAGRVKSERKRLASIESLKLARAARLKSRNETTVQHLAISEQSTK